MIFSSVIIALVLGLLFASLLTYVFKRKGPGPANGILFTFFIIFLFTWVIGLYLEPFGPVNWGVSWVGYLVTAFLIMLLLGAILPPIRPRERAVLESQAMEQPTPAEVTISIFFWILIVGLLVLAFVRVF